MKLMALGVLIAGVLCGGAAVAQTCSAPGVWHPNYPLGPALSADLCSGADSVALFCDFLDSANKNDAIYQFELVAGFTATSISVTGVGAGFNPVIYLHSGACATGSGCVQSGDAGTPVPLSGTAPGAYFIGISAAPSDASGACGSVTLVTNGNFPVSLQSFSIE